MRYSPVQPRETMTHRSTIHAMSSCSIGIPLMNYQVTAYTSGAWPLANLALFIPFQTNERCVVYEVGWGMGATAGGNFDIGIYDMAGAKIQTTGTQARTAAAWNNVNWTDLTLEPGQYYLAAAADGTNNYGIIAPPAGLCESLGICEMQTAFVLPATATLVRTTRAVIPTCALNLRSVAL